MQQQQPIKSSSERLRELEEKVESLEASMAGFVEVFKTTLIKISSVEVMADKATNRISEDLLALSQVLFSESKDLSEKVKERKIENQVAYLTNALSVLVDGGKAAMSEDGVVKENSFIVVQELDDKGNIVSVRSQMPVAALGDDKKQLILGKKVGDSVEFGEGQTTAVIQEVYDLQD